MQWWLTLEVRDKSCNKSKTMYLLKEEITGIKLTLTHFNSLRNFASAVSLCLYDQ